MSSAQVTSVAEVVSILRDMLRPMQDELARLTAANSELSAQLARLTEKVEPKRTETRAEYRARMEPVAILAIQTTGPVREQIAKETGVPVSTLRRWDRFEKALRAVQGMNAAEAVERFKPWEDELP